MALRMHQTSTVRAIYEMLPEHTYIVRHDYCIFCAGLSYRVEFWFSGLGHVHSI